MWQLTPVTPVAESAPVAVERAYDVSLFWKVAPRPAETTPSMLQANTTTDRMAERKEKRLQNIPEDQRWHGAPPEEPKTNVSTTRMGVYLTVTSAGNDKFLEETMNDLLKSGGNALVIDVKGSNVYFHASAPLANEIGTVRPKYELPEILRIAHEKGIYVIGRFISIKDTVFSSIKPETKIRHPKSNAVLSDWVDPMDPEVIRYNSEVMCDLAAAGIDEVNLDYIRFSTAEFGALRAYTGDEKADRLEVFIKAMRDAIDRCGPNTKLGLSTYAILGWNFPVNKETLGQDFVRFAPLVDVISPMAYPATFTSEGYYVPGKNPGPRDYYLVYRTLTGYADLLGPENAKKLRPWIQGYSVTSKDVADEIRAVYDAGACGFTVWSASNNYGPTFAGMTSTAALRPEHCK
jgi:hypothetical protein